MREHACRRTTVIMVLLLVMSLSSFTYVGAQANDPGSKRTWQLPSNVWRVQEFLIATDAALAAFATEDQGYWYDLFSSAVIDPSLEVAPRAVTVIVYMRWILGVRVIMPGFLVPLSVENFPDPDRPDTNLEMFVYGEELGKATRIMRSVATGEITDLDGFRRLTAILSELKPQR